MRENLEFLLLRTDVIQVPVEESQALLSAVPRALSCLFPMVRTLRKEKFVCENSLRPSRSENKIKSEELHLFSVLGGKEAVLFLG